ncbi:MAG TPA: LysM peptidoglycan-binding domain-containing protein [Flavobacteriales bacterium]
MKRLVLLIAFLGFIVALQAQETRVVDGRKYYLHTVAQGQTLYAIGKHYAVPVDALMAANPGAAQGLSIGQVLLVPQQAQVKKDLKTAPALSNGELVHTVAKKETLFGIARKYGVDQNDLLQRNPGIDQGIREGMTLVIPVAKVTTVDVRAMKPAVNDGARSHLVIAGETLFSLGQAYGVKPEEIQAANGGLPEGLRTGSYVRIPVPAIEQPVVPAIVQAASAPRSKNKVALLLPFTPKTGAPATDGAEGTKLAAATEASVQFYAGLQLALDTVKARGMNVDLHVFDTGEDPAVWGKLFKEDQVRGMDLYIGPFHRAAIEALVKVSDGAHIVCPVPQSNKVLLGNPTVSKVASGKPDQWHQIARYAAFHHPRENILLCRPDIASEREAQDQVFRQLNEGLAAQAGRLRDTVLVVKPGRRDISAVIAKLDPARLNVVVAPSDDVEFVTTLVSKLAQSTPKFRIVVYGLNSWIGMDNVEVSDLVKLNVHVPTNDFVDYGDPGVSAFIAAYRERFSNEPGEYAFLGYDIGLFYLTALKEHGRAFPDHFSEVAVKPLHLSFRFKRAGPENGWRNENATVLEYKDMVLKPAP